MTLLERLRKMSADDVAKTLCKYTGYKRPICELFCGGECAAMCDEDCIAAIKTGLMKEDNE